MPSKLIGVSLPVCIIQIVENIVRREDVKEIVAACTTDAFINHVLLNYPKGYWRNAPDKSVKLAQELYEEGLLKFPRDENENHFPITPTLEFWVQSPEDIIWFDG